MPGSGKSDPRGRRERHCDYRRGHPRQEVLVLITADMVKGMAPGSVIVDLAAERGGNCELTQTGKTVDAHGVTIIGAINLASSVPYHASQMYARNLTTFLLYMVKEGKLQDESAGRNHSRDHDHQRRGSS